MKRLFAVIAVTVSCLGVWTATVEAQNSTPIPILPILEGISNATVQTTFSNGVPVTPLPTGLGGLGSGAFPWTLVGSCLCPSNSALTGTMNSETNPVYAYFEYTYSTPNGPTNTTTDPVSMTLWAGTNEYTTGNIQTNGAGSGATGLYCDKVVSQSSNSPNLSFWLTHPN